MYSGCRWFPTQNSFPLSSQLLKLESQEKRRLYVIYKVIVGAVNKTANSKRKKVKVARQVKNIVGSFSQFADDMKLKSLKDMRMMLITMLIKMMLMLATVTMMDMIKIEC